ncbi:PLAC8 family-domain-containing protein [Kalaharituber pfeilii]|nr:PLAC8 family-domain-containing protein [Kalaharituber pfeilii]
MSGYPQSTTAYQPPHHQAGGYNHQQVVAPQTPLMNPNGPPVSEKAINGEWETGFCSCFSPIGTCCLGAWCPCILYGRTHHRLEHNGSLDGYSCCNSSCCFYGCLTILPPLNTILGYIQRKKIREQYGLSGGCCGDCVRHCYCSCCALIQEEKEVVRKTKSPGYAASGGMVYPKR